MFWLASSSGRNSIDRGSLFKEMSMATRNRVRFPQVQRLRGELSQRIESSSWVICPTSVSKRVPPSAHCVEHSAYTSVNIKISLDTTAGIGADTAGFVL